MLFFTRASPVFLEMGHLLLRLLLPWEILSDLGIGTKMKLAIVTSCLSWLVEPPSGWLP